MLVLFTHLSERFYDVRFDEFQCVCRREQDKVASVFRVAATPGTAFATTGNIFCFSSHVAPEAVRCIVSNTRRCHGGPDTGRCCDKVKIRCCNSSGTSFGRALSMCLRREKTPFLLTVISVTTVPSFLAVVWQKNLLLDL